MSTEQQSEQTVASTTESTEAKSFSNGGWVAQAERITRIVERLIWMMVLVIITAAVANFLKMQSPNFGKLPSLIENIPVERPIPIQIDQEIASALRSARIETENFASARLDLWKDDVMKRVDNNFLDWYFGYWNQQVLGFKYIFQGAYHWFNSNAPTPEEAQAAIIQREFEQRVLPPEVTQARFSQLIEDSVNLYTQELSQRIDAIPSRYKIPQGKWEKYLSNLALIADRSEGNREVSLAEKGVFVTTGAGGIYTAGKAFTKLAKFGGMQAIEAKAGAQVASKVASKTASKVAAKSGAKLVGKLGVEAIGSVLGVGIIAWDVWDHYHTRATQLPILRENIEEYLDQVKASLLKDPTTGLISVIYDLEEQVLKASKSYRGA